MKVLTLKMETEQLLDEVNCLAYYHDLSTPSSELSAEAKG